MLQCQVPTCSKLFSIFQLATPWNLDTAMVPGSHRTGGWWWSPWHLVVSALAARGETTSDECRCGASFFEGHVQVRGKNWNHLTLDLQFPLSYICTSVKQMLLCMINWIFLCRRGLPTFAGETSITPSLERKGLNAYLSCWKQQLGPSLFQREYSDTFQPAMTISSEWKHESMWLSWRPSSFSKGL